MKKLPTLFWVFFYTSTITLGGGMAMLPVFTREFVDKRHWLTSDEMVDIVAVMQSLPGLIATNMAVLIGYRISGVLGAIVSAFASIITPFIAIVFVATGHSKLAESALLNKMFLGVRAGVTALILLSAIKLAGNILKSPLAWVLGTASFIACVFFEVNVTYVIVFGFLVGFVMLFVKALQGAKK